METYDLVIVGSGSGLMVLEAALEQGLSCALVEKDPLGGTCLNRGCIPSKVLVYPADVIREAEHAARVGVHFDPPEVDWPTIAKRMWTYIGANKQIEAGLKKSDHLALYRGTGVFTGPDTMQVADERSGRIEPFSGRMFVLAPGARTLVPPIQGLESVGFVTSESFFGSRFPEKPWKSLTIVGGGAIGLEFAHIFSAQGTRVTIVEMASRLAPLEEPEVSVMLEEQMRVHGIRVLTGYKAVAAKLEQGLKTLVLEPAGGGAAESAASEEILLAAGVRSNADLLQVDQAFIATDSRGYIVTNEYLETNRKHIWALGDANGKFQFRHKANYEAEVLIHNLFRPDLSRRQAQYNAVPWAIFTSPQIAHAGLGEEQVKAAGIRYQVGVNHYADIAKGYAMGYRSQDKDNGFVKLIVDENRKILGAHIVGPEAAVLIQSFVYLMNAGYTCPDQQSRSGGRAKKKERAVPGLFPPCPEAGTLDPVSRSMVIHPSLSELTAWVIDELEWVEPDS